MGKEILNIACPHCGSPANFDIIRQIYRCSSCGQKVEIEDARQEKIAFQQEQRQRIKKSAASFSMFTTSCTGCGATLVFDKNESVSNCAFCGRSLVRKDYIYDEKLPQNIIPFALTKEEAVTLLKKWCEQNQKRVEAKHLLQKAAHVQGYYLPYEMVRGPVRCAVWKKGETKRFNADGYVKDSFVNCSSQLNNLLLDNMEPFDTEQLKEFDFSYVAGQRVKIGDIDEKDVQNRLNDETAENYRSDMEKIWGTRAIELSARVDPVVKIPVLLPVYYIADGNVNVAVNGQTGKVSVRAEKDSSFISAPWWLGGSFVLILVCAVIYLAVWSSGFSREETWGIIGAVALFFLIVFTAMFSDSSSNGFHKITYRDIFSTGTQTYSRKQGRLVLNEEIVKRKIEAPVFKEVLDGKERAVMYTFRSLKRITGMALISIAVMFFPVILAPIILVLFTHGFDFSRIYIGGSAVWFCITVPTVPIIFIRYSIQFLYDSPLIYTIAENGKKKRYRRKSEVKAKDVFHILLRALFSFPLCLATWFALAILVLTIYFTAFGA